MKILLPVLLLVLEIFSQKYMVLNKDNQQTLIDLRDIDSITFIDSSSLIPGTIITTKPFFHRVDEFNTRAIGIVGDGNDNDYGAGFSGIAHHAAVPVTFADIAVDPRVRASVPLNRLYNAQGENLQIKIGDILTVTATIPNSAVPPADETLSATFEVIDNPAMAGRVGVSSTEFQVANIQQLLLATQEFLTNGPWNGGGGSNVSGAKIAIMPDGKVRILNGATSTEAIKNFTVTSNRPISRNFVGNAFLVGTSIAPGAYSETSGPLLRPAQTGDNLYNPMFFDAAGSPLPGVDPVVQIFDVSGVGLDLQEGDTLCVSAIVGTSVKDSRKLTIDKGTGWSTSTTLQEMVDTIRSTLALPEFDGSPQNNPSVSISNGAVVVRGQPGAAFKITNFAVTAKSPLSVDRTVFNQNMQ